MSTRNPTVGGKGKRITPDIPKPIPYPPYVRCECGIVSLVYPSRYTVYASGECECGAILHLYLSGKITITTVSIDPDAHKTA